MTTPLDLTELGAAEVRRSIIEGATTVAAIVEAALERIASSDGHLRAWVAVDEGGARAQADALDAAMASGRAIGPLHGLPVGVKDIIDVAGLPTTCGAAAFAHRHPDHDAILVARLRAAGAVIVGKTVATEFAYKDPAPTLNPWSGDHTPGGSSSGSAAAVAARHVPIAIGTQTVGSILRPSAFCGVVGLKGEHGAVPLDGVMPLAPSLDDGGPITRSVADAALVQAVLSGRLVDVEPVRTPRLAVSPELFALAEPTSRDRLDALVGRLADAGAEVVEVTMPESFGPLRDAGRVILEAEAASVHEAMFRAHAAEYGPQIAGLVRAGLEQTPGAVEEARAVQAAFRAAVILLLDGFDALLSPVAPGPAPLRTVGTGDFALCAPWSTAGVPSIAIPTDLDDAGLPLAIQLTGAPDRFGRLLGTAAWCEAQIAFDARPHATIST
jgi:Asp-tRNA(Asn)/Glu-tRNA(Gln) amidotransferase A subunit family amidase